MTGQNETLIVHNDNRINKTQAPQALNLLFKKIITTYHVKILLKRDCHITMEILFSNISRMRRCILRPCCRSSVENCKSIFCNLILGS